ncbi:MAG TPA: ABC transporter substrate-binding protein [Chloroflexota bacterium]|nr:ABC transporter substrate-binding protein [Chloroflexota bacterium]
MERRPRHPVRALAIVALSMTALVLAACGGRAAPPASAPSNAPSAPSGGGQAPAASQPSAPAASKPATSAAAYRPTPLNPPVSLQVGVVSSSSDGGIFIAMDRGYFEEEGLQIETQQFQTGVDQIAPLGAGQLDVGTGAIAAGLYNAIGRGVPLRMVADKGSTPAPEWDFNALMVRKDLIDSGQVQDYKDLKGLTITTTAPGNSTEVDVAKALEKGGLTFADINFTHISFSDMITAFQNHAIDAAIVIEPYLSRIEKLGTAVRWKGTRDFYGNQQVAVVMYGPKLVEEQQDVARRWMIAYLRGVRDYNDAFGPKRQGREQVIQTLIKHTPIKDAATYEEIRPAGLDPDGKLDLASIRSDLAYYEQSGRVTQQIDLNQVIDTSFAEYAVQQLGPYQR